MDTKCLNIGQSINIRRSDGRVHLAAISGIDTEKCLISVEWFEDNETKGKEIDFASILTTNKGLCKPAPRIKNSENNSGPPVVSNIAKGSRGALNKAYHRRTVATPKAKKVAPLPVAPAKPTQVLAENDESDNVIKGGQRERHDQRVVSGAPGRIRGGGRMAVEKGPRGGARPGLGPNEGKEEANDVLPPIQQMGVGLIKDRDVLVAAPAAAKPRKSISVCVKEVQKLKKNREDRRAKQAEQIAQKSEYCDVSHPNWEFYQMMQEFKATIRIMPFLANGQVLLSKINVCVRKRPLNKKEIARQEIDVVTIPDKGSVLIHEPKTKVDLTRYLENQSFTFDCSFDESVSNEVVYRHTAKPLVRTVFDRGMATCFAYGQTGSGKTHTMGGVFSGKEQDPSKGIYSLAASDIFALNSTPANAKKKLSIYASFFEIYGGKVFDLLNKKEKLRILEDQKQQVQIVGLVEEEVGSVPDVLRLIQVGNKCRTSGVTSANQHSSRSHAVFQLLIRTRSNLCLYGKFSLIDLAGNERGADTATSDRLTRMEGAEINKSLLALKECIRALGRKGAHLPFRGSKLTLVLKDSFVGENSRTCMIAMISPGFNSCEHTLNTLRYADRVKELRGGGAGGAISAGDDFSHQHLVHRPGDLSDKDSHSHLDPDLQYLHRSLHKDDGGDLDMNESSELLTFHEAINNLVESEEQLVEEHKAIIQADQYLLEEEERLLLYVEDNDHDIEQYMTRMEMIISQKLERLSNFKERIQDLKQRLREEETASRKVKRLPML